MRKASMSLFVLFSSVATLALAETKYVEQMLEPLGGKIDRPEGWFYAERHRGPSYSWILSKEDPDKGPYETGMRIQTFNGVKEGTGKTAKEFVFDFARKKADKAEKLVSTVPESEQGGFTRVGIETIEGKYQIMYSCFWSDTIDMVIITTAGAPKELWEEYTAIFNHMASFELIDLKRFQDKE